MQHVLPPEVRGQAIGKGPLPFLFNAKSEDIKQRFWLQVITPSNAKGEYWLEAVPKTQEDAANFKMIHVIIDVADYLPKAMVLFDTSYVPGTRPSRTTFQFNDREVNFSILTEQLNLFHREFYEPKLPAGWTRKVNRADSAPLPPRMRPSAACLRTVPLLLGADQVPAEIVARPGDWCPRVRCLSVIVFVHGRLPAVSGPVPVPTRGVSAASGRPFLRCFPPP